MLVVFWSIPSSLFFYKNKNIKLLNCWQINAKLPLALSTEVTTKQQTHYDYYSKYVTYIYSWKTTWWQKNLFDVSFNDKILRNLVKTSNKMFLNLKRKGSILEREMKYFAYDYKNASNLGKF